MQSEWIAALIGAAVGVIGTELSRFIGRVLKRRRLRPSANADLLITDEGEPALASLDLFVQNPREYPMRPRSLHVKGYPEKGYIMSWRAEDSPLLEPRHVTRVGVSPERCLEAAERLGLDGEVKLTMNFYDGSSCTAVLDFERAFLESVFSVWPPPVESNLKYGVHAGRIRAARERAQKHDPGPSQREQRTKTDEE